MSGEIVPSSPASPPRQDKALYQQLVKWSRRVKSFVAYGVVISWFFGGHSPIAMAAEKFAPITLFGLHGRDVCVLLLICWYAFLSQLTIRWALWLPFYVLLFPVWCVLWVVGKAALRPVLDSLTRAGEAGASPPASKGESSQRRFPWKQGWMVLFFIWLISLRAVDASWVAWVPPILLIPIWLWFLRMAYHSATSPITFAEKPLSWCRTIIESLEKPTKDAVAKPVDPGSETALRWFANLIRRLLRRYSLERVFSVVHREALLVFSIALLSALGMSALFWALVGRAVHHSSPLALSGYRFFAEWNFAEFVLWAFGCMTTSIAFPGSEASVSIKVFHAAILATGIFQITYLLACFSIMASAVGGEVARETGSVASNLTERLERVLTPKLDAGRGVEGKVVDPGGDGDGGPPPLPPVSGST